MFSTIQMMSLIFAILTIFIFLYWRKKNKNISLYIVPAMLWLLHVVVFYTIDLMDISGVHDFHQYNQRLFSEWSPYLRFHGIFTLFYFSTIESEITHDIFMGVKRLWKQLKS